MLYQLTKLVDPQCLGTCCKVISEIRVQSFHFQLLVTGRGLDMTVENTAEGGRTVRYLPAGVRTTEVTELEDVAILAIELDLLLDLFFFNGIEVF